MKTNGPIVTNSMKVANALGEYKVGDVFSTRDIVKATGIKTKHVASLLFQSYSRQRGVIEKTGIPGEGQFKVVKNIADLNLRFLANAQVTDEFCDRVLALFKSPHHICRTKAFANIAERLGISRPAMTNQINRMIGRGDLVRVAMGRYRLGRVFEAESAPTPSPAQTQVPITMAEIATPLDGQPAKSTSSAQDGINTTADLLEAVALQLRSLDIPAPRPAGILLSEASNEQITAELRRRLSVNR